VHIITHPRQEIITVDFNGKRFHVTMTDDGAYVPNDLGEYMWRRGLVAKGYNPDPKPRWQLLPNGDGGTMWGDRIDPFARYVKEIPKSDVDETATPEAVAAILERKRT
jgi:hypothetical protein